MDSGRVYFRQLLAGRDFAVRNAVATQMVNFVYLLGDREKGEALVVDPAYGVAELVAIAAQDGMKLVGALGTHYHPDHVGGDLFGTHVQGARELLALQGMKLHVQREEAPWVRQMTGLSDSDMTLHDSSDKVTVGDMHVELIHTPGHTPGSQCFLFDGRLIAGDTLFLEGCGRTDLPGGDPEALFFSLNERLGKVPDDAVLFPGHLYSRAPSAKMGDTRKSNHVFKPRTPAAWMQMFGG